MSKRPIRRLVKSDATTAPPDFPFAALVGQAEMKLALLLNVIEPAVGGALIMGQRGTGKSTAVRALADLLPPVACVRGCVYNCDPTDEARLCADCRARLLAEGRLPSVRARVPVVELPLNATEDRVCGTLSFERALAAGVKEFEPGLLARANRGFLYIDEVNLLEDHLVDLLLDAAAVGRNRVEREGISVTHPARFVLIGSGNPEEGELRPQLLDRFGLCVEVRTPPDVDERVEVVARHEAFARDPHAFCAQMEAEQARLRRRVVRARRTVADVAVERALMRRIAELCQRLQVDGHRGELTITRAARALAAFEGRRSVTDADVRRVAPLALRHRLRRDPFEQSAGEARLEQGVAEIFGSADANSQAAERARATPDDKDVPPDGDGSGGDQRPRPPSHADAESRAADAHGAERIAPLSDSPLNIDLRATRTGTERQTRPARMPSRQKGRTSAPAPALRGRYVRAVARERESPRLALDATLRAAALRRAQGQVECAARRGVARDDLRFKQFAHHAGTLFIFALDTSGSMALNRIEQAKGALARLLRQSYVNRDEVALVSFRERRAELLLRPSRSAARARRLLDALPVGGATPLAAGLLRAYEVARTRGRTAARIVLLVFTDGRANVPLNGQIDAPRAALKTQIERELEQAGALLRQAGMTIVVVDTRQRFTAGEEGRRLAHMLGGRYVSLPGASQARA